jgi:hypothetical protein
MPRVLKAYNTDYKISVQDGGEITLDTGVDVGTVVVTGDLRVQGELTTVNTTDLAIEDNVIVLNRVPGEDPNDPGATEGVTEGTSGIEIYRGSLVPVRWIYDESVNWSLGGLSGTGTFYAQQGTRKLPLNTPGIRSDGTLYVDTGTGVISVTGTQNYEESVFNYVGGDISPAADGSIVLDDDHIPNAKGIADFISYSFANNLQPSIQQGDTKVEAIDDNHVISEIISINTFGNGTTVLATDNPHGFTGSDTVDISGIDGNGDPIEGLNGTDIDIVEIINQFSFRIDRSVSQGDITNYVLDSGIVQKTNAAETRIQVTVAGVDVSEFYEDRFRVEGIEISQNEIKSFENDTDLVLTAAGTGAVKVDDALELSSFPWEDDTDIPQAPASGAKIYANQTNTSGVFENQTPGKSGIFFVNSNQTRDELIAKNRSLLYSMLF